MWELFKKYKTGMAIYTFIVLIVGGALVLKFAVQDLTHEVKIVKENQIELNKKMDDVVTNTDQRINDNYYKIKIIDHFANNDLVNSNPYWRNEYAPLLRRNIFVYDTTEVR